MVSKIRNLRTGTIYVRGKLEFIRFFVYDEYAKIGK